MLFFKKYKHMHRVAIAVLCLVIAWVLFRPYSIKVYRFHRPSCPYCVNSQAEWDKFRFYSMFSTTQTININLNEMEGEKMARQYGVKTVPTVIGVTADGYMEKYDGERTANGYQQWVNEITG